MLKGKKILLGITGSIAAYKSILLSKAVDKGGRGSKSDYDSFSKRFCYPFIAFNTFQKSCSYLICLKKIPGPIM